MHTLYFYLLLFWSISVLMNFYCLIDLFIYLSYLFAWLLGSLLIWLFPFLIIGGGIYTYLLTDLLHTLFIGFLICSLPFYISRYWFTLLLAYLFSFLPACSFIWLLCNLLSSWCDDLFAYLCIILFISFTHSLFG